MGGIGLQKDLRAANPAWSRTISHTICNMLLPDPDFNLMVGNFTQAIDTIQAFMRPLSVDGACYGNEVRRCSLRKSTSFPSPPKFPNGYSLFALLTPILVQPFSTEL